MVSDEIVEKAARACAESAWAGGWQFAPERERDVLRERMRAALEAATPAIRAAAMEEAAVLVETHTYTVSNREPAFSLQPSPRAKDDMHHRTIAAAIRAAKEAS